MWHRQSPKSHNKKAGRYRKWKINIRWSNMNRPLLRLEVDLTTGVSLLGFHTLLLHTEAQTQEEKCIPAGWYKMARCHESASEYKTKQEKQPIGIRVETWLWGDILAGKCSNNHQTQAHVPINTRALAKKMSHKHASTKPRDTHTHIFCGSVLVARELPAVGDLWENRTPPVPLSSPHKPRETLRPTAATSFYPLILRLMAACPAIFYSTVYPRLCCSFPSLLRVLVISKHQIPRHYFRSHQGFFFCFYWWESHLIPVACTW